MASESERGWKDGKSKALVGLYLPRLLISAKMGILSVE
jgi:hypothetical protein